jgi:hypothetical protein
MASNVATIEPRAQVPAVGEVAHFELMQRKAALFAASPLIPESLRAGGPQQALANCYIGLQMAEAMQENALTVLQNIHVVKGKAGFSAQFMIARANASGIFKDGIDWRVDLLKEGFRPIRWIAGPRPPADLCDESGAMPLIRDLTTLETAP